MLYLPTLRVVQLATKVLKVTQLTKAKVADQQSLRTINH
jgi:hypothetical protein